MTPGDIVMMLNLAYERDAFEPTDVPAYAYTYSVPGAFVQDDIDVSRWLAVSASGRVDAHDQFGTFVSPRASIFVHRPA